MQIDVVEDASLKNNVFLEKVVSLLREKINIPNCKVEIVGQACYYQMVQVFQIERRFFFEDKENLLISVALFDKTSIQATCYRKDVEEPLTAVLQSLGEFGIRHSIICRKGY